MFHATIESRDGPWRHVVFEAESQPAVLFKPAQGSWDWSATGKLMIPVENLEDEPLTFLLRIESAGGRSLSGKLAIAPHEAGELAIWTGAPSPRAMGMIAGPSPRAAGLAANIFPVTATEGSVDPSWVTSIRLGISRPKVPRHAFIGTFRVEPSEAGKTVYDGIVDGFGQFSAGDWPEKVSSVDVLRARGVEEMQEIAQPSPDMPKRDRFGGLVDAGGFRPTGFFHTEQRDGRWWLVSPEGNGFFSIGIDAIAPSGATYVEDREFMFRDLPAPDGPFKAHWSQRDDRHGLGAQRGRSFDHGRAFDFYTANLERKFGLDWRARWREETLDRLSDWGFNTIGDWSAADLAAMHRLPFTVPLSPEGEYAKVSSGEDWWGPMPDPFDPRFAAAADKMASNAAAQFRGDAYLIGYFVDNELAWRRGSSANPRERYSLALNVLSAGSESPAKSAFIAYLTETYREPQALAQAWGLSIESWEALRGAGFSLPEATLDNSAILRDLSAFTQRFAQAYFRIVAEALRRHDPDHLYLGSRFAWQTSEAVEACAQWCDVVSFNRYRRSIADDAEEWARFHHFGKPALIGEFHFGSTDRGLFWEGLVGGGRESERGPAYSRYLHAVADNPDFVGAHWFQYIDEPLTGRTLDGENAHIGFITVADVPYKEFVAAVRIANTGVLRDLQSQSVKSHQ